MAEMIRTGTGRRLSEAEAQRLSVLNRLTGVHLEITRSCGIIRIRDKHRTRYFKELQIIPNEQTRFYWRIRQGAVNKWLARIGIIFMGCWMIPTVLVEQSHNIFYELREEFQDNIERLRSNFDGFTREFRRQYPENADITDNPRYNADSILSKFRFSWRFFKVHPIDSWTLKDEFMEDVANLAQYLYQDVAKSAESAWQKIFSSRESLTGRAASPLKYIRSKFESLNFLNPLIPHTIKLIDAALMDVPLAINHEVHPEAADLLRNAMWILMDPDRCQAYSEMVAEGQSPLSVLKETIKPRVFAKDPVLIEID